MVKINKYLKVIGKLGARYFYVSIIANSQSLSMRSHHPQPEGEFWWEEGAGWKLILREKKIATKFSFSFLYFLVPNRGCCRCLSVCKELARGCWGCKNARRIRIDWYQSPSGKNRPGSKPDPGGLMKINKNKNKVKKKNQQEESEIKQIPKNRKKYEQ